MNPSLLSIVRVEAFSFRRSEPIFSGRTAPTAFGGGSASESRFLTRMEGIVFRIPRMLKAIREKSRSFLHERHEMCYICPAPDEGGTLRRCFWLFLVWFKAFLFSGLCSRICSQSLFLLGRLRCVNLGTFAKFPLELCDVWGIRSFRANSPHTTGPPDDRSFVAALSPDGLPSGSNVLFRERARRARSVHARSRSQDGIVVAS